MGQEFLTSTTGAPAPVAHQVTSASENSFLTSKNSLLVLVTSKNSLLVLVTSKNSLLVLAHLPLLARMVTPGHERNHHQPLPQAYRHLPHLARELRAWLLIRNILYEPRKNFYVASPGRSRPRSVIISIDIITVIILIIL